MAENWIIHKSVDLQTPPKLGKTASEYVIMYPGDNLAHTLKINILDNGIPALTLTGSIAAYFQRKDGETVLVTGSISDGVASVTMAQECYAIPGFMRCVVRLTNSSTEAVVTLAEFTFTVQPPIDSGEIIDPGEAIGTIDELLAQIEAMEEATAAAEAAAAAVPDMVAPTFSASTAYTSGQYVYYDGGLYRFTTDHAAGSWNASHVVAVTVGGEVADLKSAMESKPETKDTDADNVDLDITDEDGNVILRLMGGDIQTKNFDSKKVSPAPTDAENSDMDIIDEHGNVLARFADGGIETKNFDSSDAMTRLSGAEANITALNGAVGGYAVPSYWVSYLETKEATINDLNMALTSGESFVFFTDYHQGSNNKNSMQLMRHILDHTSIRDVVYGGDTTDGGTLPTPAAAKAVVRNFANLMANLKIKTVRGNHDCEPTAYQTINQIPDEAFYDLLIRPIENDIVCDNKLYFYWDNTNQKIRHIVLDSGGMNDALTETQLTWMKSCLTELETGWTAVIFQHMVVESTPAEETVHMITRGTKTLNAIGDVYSQLNCTIAALVCGHLHVDTIVDTSFNFKIIGTTCDAGGANSQGYDWNNPTRPAGTTNEQAFDVYSIDTTNRTINITRIGAGSDRTATY